VRRRQKQQEQKQQEQKQHDLLVQVGRLEAAMSSVETVGDTVEAVAEQIVVVEVAGLNAKQHVISKQAVAGWQNKPTSL
jgi:hypothetical protein